MNRETKDLLIKKFPFLYQTIRNLLRRPLMKYFYHRRPDSLDACGAYTKGSSVKDKNLIDRLVASYLKRADSPDGIEISRSLYWMRREYVEEVVDFRKKN